MAVNHLALGDQAAVLSRVNGKNTRPRRLVSLFLDGVPAKMVDIVTAIANDQFGDVNYIAHEIKDVAGNLGGMELMKRLSKFRAVPYCATDWNRGCPTVVYDSF